MTAREHLCLRRRLRAALVALAVLALASGVRPALARSFTMESVTIDATVEADGTLTAREEREFDFDGSFNGVYWNIPTGTYQGRTITTTITGVGEVVDGTYVGYERADSGANHTYELIEHANYVQVKVYTAHEDERARVVVSYADTNLATRHDDTAELYWKFVSDGWDEESRNVVCTVHLPVPDGVGVVGGENVRAWGHGPLDASVAFVGNDVVYTVPVVGTDEFAEARIAFPAEWLSGATPTGATALDDILVEEQAWADEANARRAAARALIGGGVALGIGVPIIAVVVAVIRRRKYKQAHRPSFDDEYFRDVPSDDHPAVLGALYHDGTPNEEDLTASLMRLTDMGVVRLEPVRLKTTGMFGRVKERDDFRLTSLDRPIEGTGGALARGIDTATADLMFRKFARHAKRDKYAADVEVGDGVLYFSELEGVAKHEPEYYSDSYKSWQAKVEAACTQRRFSIDDHKIGRGPVIAVGVLSLLAGIGAFLLLISADAYLLAFVSVGMGIACAVVAFALASNMDPLSDEAIELRAKLEALRRWLKDFTRLKEAVPNDVVLWNRLLVMATALGVAKEVIDQLKVVAPQLLADDGIAPVYGWYYYGSRRLMPASAFHEAASNAHSVSVAKLASSSDSDGGGGGGGFSGGGGGGFGGGGGGGAF